MKKSTIYPIILFLVIAACERSQFAVTTRHSKNGKVTYANHYKTEPSQWVKVKTHKSRVKANDAQNIPQDSKLHEILNLPGSEITRISTASAYGQGSLLASNSKDPLILAVNETRLISGDKQLDPDKTLYTAEKSRDNPDTVRKNIPEQEKTSNTTGKRIIKFKDGHIVIGKIVSQTSDTLKFMQSALEDAVSKTPMSKVETILPDTRQIEPLGIISLVCSLLAFLPFLLGLLPVLGIPLAVIGIVLGIISIKRIKRHIAQYKGKGFGQAGLVVGVAAMVLIIILLISMVASAFSGCSSVTYSV
ncbi:MAG: DUF4190 domain-containing protein [Bacteroidota bacterium]|jgi:hypothetical protein